ncbi:MAG: hypothetical protein IJC36_01160 [Clostridia bacterium]|nr:hypothetical protein [Clostridia bacterium]
MKRVLAVLLCLLVLVSSFATVLFSNVSADNFDNVFENPANWKRYDFTSKYVNDASGVAGASWASVSENTNTAYAYDDASSVKVSAKIQYSTVEFDVTPNTEYELTYRFLANGAKYNSSGVDTYIIRTGVVSPNGSIEWGKDGYYSFMSTTAAYTAPNGVFANRVSLAERTSDWSDEGVWHKVTLKFASGDNEKMKLVVQSGADTMYLDEFELKEEYDFEALSHWGIYSATTTDSNYNVVTSYDGESCQLKNDWCNITASTAEDADASGKSVRINGNAFNVAANLPALKPNTKYTLSFKYKPGATTVVAGSNGAYFTSHIIKKGTAFNSGKSGPAEFVADLGKGTETGDWKEISVDFTTDSTTDYMLEFRFAFAAGYECFLDAFSLTEKEKATYFIQDFEDYTKSKSEYVGSISIVTPTGSSVSGSKALLYDGTAAGANISEGSNRVVLNPSNSGLPTLSEIVKKGDKFKITFKYKLLSGEVKFYVGSTSDGASAWSHVSPNPISYKSTTLSAGDTWQEFSYDFTLNAAAEDNAAKYPIFFIGGAGKAYFDYIAVSTLSANVPDVGIPDETVPEADPFEDIANWGLYHKDAKGDYAGYATIDGTAPAKRDWASVAINENATFTSTGSGKSVKLYGNTVLNAVKLTGVEANTNYTLSFKYLITKDSTWGSSSKSWFTPGIVKKGVAMNGTTPAEYFVTGSKVTTPASPANGSWSTYTLEFTTDATTDLFFTLYATFASGFTIYADEFALTKKEATPEPESNPFEDIANWGLYHKDAIGDYAGYATIDGTAPAKRDWASATINENATFTSTGSGKSVKLYGNTVLNAVKIPDLKANTNYILTFKYLIAKDSTWGTSKAWFTPALVKKGTAMSGGAPAEYFKKDANVATPASPANGSWATYTMNFTTDATTEYFFTIYSLFASGFTIYVDEFAVTEGEPIPEPTPTDGDYDNAASWKLYHENYAPTVNGNGPTENGWIKNTQNTNKAYTYNGGEKSIMISGNIQYTAVKLNDLEKGKAYKVSFKYFAPTTSTVGSSSKAWVNQVGVIAGGTNMTGNTPDSYVKKGAVFAGEAGKWHEYSMLFRANSTDLYFGMCLTFGSGYIIYVDDFTVTETDEDPDIVPVVPGKEPKEQIVIDFDNYGGDATLSPKDRMEIVEAEAYDGKKSKMLHFIKGAYSSATTLNYSTTFLSDTDDVFTVGVKPKKVYKLSFRVKTNSQTLPDDATKGEWIAIYASFGKQNIVSSYQHTARRDEWRYCEYNVTTSAEQNLLSFYVNAGEYTPDMWIDDITLTETDYEPFLGWGTEPRDEILINFDDFYVGYDIACASIVDGPARDGKVTKATYLKGGSYDYNVVANYSAVTGYRDPVFTVPCKENTLYEFSYYIYIPKDTGTIPYFAVYYDWANTWVLRSSAMTERDQWVKRSIRFTTKPGQTQLSFTFNGGKMIPDIYLDDILLRELKPGVINYSNNASYSETYYNVFENEGLTNQVNKSKTTVIKIPVSKQLQYTFGLSIASLKKSNSRVFLSFDGVNPMNPSDVGAPSAIFTSDGKSRRVGIDFISGSEGYIYLVIENDDGSLKLSDPYLFNTASLSTNLAMGMKNKPSAKTLSVNANKGELLKLIVFGSDEEFELLGDNPSTGSQTVIPVIMLAFTLLIACILLVKFKKGGEQA